MSNGGTAQSDPGGYLRLRRGLSFITAELRAEGEPEAAEEIERAVAFFGGSATEFLGESLLALEGAHHAIEALNRSLAAFAAGLAAEIREGFDRIGGA